MIAREILKFFSILSFVANFLFFAYKYESFSPIFRSFFLYIFHHRQILQSGLGGSDREHVSSELDFFEIFRIFLSLFYALFRLFSLKSIEQQSNKLIRIYFLDYCNFQEEIFLEKKFYAKHVKFPDAEKIFFVSTGILMMIFCAK